MKVFAGFETNTRNHDGPQKVSSKKIHNRHDKSKIQVQTIKRDGVNLDLSPDEIREKIKNNQMKKNDFEKKISKDDEIPSELKVPSGQLNDPTDTNTVEKLKDVLKSGSFNFSEKTRQVLGEILKERSE